MLRISASRSWFHSDIRGQVPSGGGGAAGQALVGCVHDAQTWIWGYVSADFAHHLLGWHVSFAHGDDDSERKTQGDAQSLRVSLAATHAEQLPLKVGHAMTSA